MADSLWYPSVEDVIAIHDDVVSEYPGTPAGVRNRSDLEFALEYIVKRVCWHTPDSARSVTRGHL
jgi:death-on-curing protein